MKLSLTLLSIVSLSLLSFGCTDTNRNYSMERYAIPPEKVQALTRGCGAGHRPQTWGVIIGINEYQDEGITDLKGSVSDAWIFYHYLTSPAGGAIPANNLKLLLNQEATRTEVEGAIGNFLGQSCPSDKVIIYFAGHGAPEPGRESDAFLLMHDTKLDNMVGSAISMQRLPDFLSWRTDEVGELLLVVDACHSGNISFPNQRGVRKPPNVAAKERSKGIDESLKTLSTQKKKWSVISAAAANQFAGELKGDCGNGVEYTGGLFTCHMLEALKGAADRNQDGGLSVAEVFKYVRSKVSMQTAGTQTPTFSGDTESDKNFFKVPNGSTQIEIPKVPEVYLIQEYRSAYTPARWTGLGLSVAAGVASALLSSEANDFTREVNTFNYRSRTTGEYEQLLSDRNSAIQSATTMMSITGVMAAVTIATALLERYDRPEGRPEVYKLKPWFTLPVSNGQVNSSLGLEVSF